MTRALDNFDQDIIEKKILELKDVNGHMLSDFQTAISKGINNWYIEYLSETRDIDKGLLVCHKKKLKDSLCSILGNMFANTTLTFELPGNKGEK